MIKTESSYTPVQKKAVRATMELHFDLYRKYKYTEFQGREARITTSYELREHGSTNQKVDPTATIAIYNVEEAARRKFLCYSLEIAMDLLKETQRQVIERRYMKRNQLTDGQLCAQLGITKDTYNKHRIDGMIELAVFLEIEI